MTAAETTTREAPMLSGGLPVLGHALEFKRNPLAFLMRARSAGDVARVRLGPKTAYVVNDEDLIRQVFVSQAQSFDKGVFWEKVAAIVGNGLANSSGATHLRQRRLMQPMFHRQRIARYAEIIAEDWDERVSSWRAGQTLALPDELARIALSMVVKTVFGSRVGEDAVHAILKHFAAVQDGLLWRTMNPFPVLEKIPTKGNRRVNEGIEAIWTTIDKTIAAYRADGTDHGDLLTMLIAARDEDTGEGMTDSEVRDQVLTIALAGTDTTANAMCWALYELGQKPDIAERIAAEVADVVGDGPITFDDLARLTYTDQVVREVFRFYSFWGLMRRTTTDVTLGGINLAANSQVLLSPVALHRDPDVWPEAATFDPDRWADGGDVRRTSYIAFGAGARQCIGDRFAWTEIMTGLAAICRRWQLRPAPGQVTSETFKFTIIPDVLNMTVTER